MRVAGQLTRPLLRLAGLLCLASPLAAQSVAGVGEDAIPVPSGTFRIGTGAIWDSYDEVFRRDGAGGISRQPLLGRLTTPALGAAELPALAPAQQAIRSLTGSDFIISLGRLDAQGERRIQTAPIALSYGVTRRVALSLLVPYVETRTTTRLLLNEAGTGANVGLNPAYASASQARATNAQLLRQIAAARTLLSNEIARCANEAETGCDAIRANPNGAQALLAESLQTEQALSTVYGDSLSGGSLVAPVVGSALHEAVLSHIAGMRSGFVAFGIDAIGEDAAPVGANTIMGPGSLSRIIGDTAVGPGYETIGNIRRAGIGDVDVSATVLLYDSFNADVAARFSPQGISVRSAATIGWRFGTANADWTSDPFDVPTGDGANALLARSTTDFVFGRRFWVSATARMEMPFADDVAVPVPILTDSTVLRPFRIGNARRELGSRLQFEIAPRAAIGEFFGVSAAYQMRHWGVDRYSIDPLPAGGNVVDLVRDHETESRTLHSVAFGVTYSSLARYTNGRARLPVEVLFVHSQPLFASGELVPAVATDQLVFRFYLWHPRRGN